MPALLAICLVASVHDGDTVWCGREKVRLDQIDAPELKGSPSCAPRKRAKHWCDYDLGVRSRDALAKFLMRGEVTMQRTGIDYYGRTLAKLTVNGRDAGEYLVSRELAKRW